MRSTTQAAKSHADLIKLAIANKDLAAFKQARTAAGETLFSSIVSSNDLLGNVIRQGVSAQGADKAFFAEASKEMQSAEPAVEISAIFMQHAIERGSAQEVRQLLKTGVANVSTTTLAGPNKDNMNAAEYALFTGKEEISRMVIGYAGNKNPDAKIVSDAFLEKMKDKAISSSRRKLTSAVMAQYEDGTLALEYAASVGDIAGIERAGKGKDIEVKGTLWGTKTKHISPQLDIRRDGYNTPISEAAKRGDHKTVRALASLGASLTYREPRKIGPFSLPGSERSILDDQLKTARDKSGAAKDGAEKIRDALVEGGVKLKAGQFKELKQQYGMGKSALDQNLSGVVGRNISQPNRIATYLAAETGKTSMVKYLVDSKGPSIACSNAVSGTKNQQTAFHAAVRSGNRELVSYLTDKMSTPGSFDFTKKDARGKTVLHAAAETSAKTGDAKIVADVMKMAHQHEQRRNRWNPFRTPQGQQLVLAQDKSGGRFLDSLVTVPVQGPGRVAALQARVEMIKSLKKELASEPGGLDINDIAFGRRGTDPEQHFSILRAVVARGDADLVSEIVKIEGIDVNAARKRDKKSTTLDYSAMDVCIDTFDPAKPERTETIMKALVQGGATIVSEKSSSILHKVATSKQANPELLKIAIKSIPNNQLPDALTKPSIVHKKGWIRNYDQEGPSMLQTIIDSGNVVMLDAALQQLQAQGIRLDELKIKPHGAAKNAPDVPILTYATMQGQDQIVRNMLKNGMNPNVTDGRVMNGETPLATAIRGVHHGVDRKNVESRGFARRAMQYIPGARSSLSSEAYKRTADALLENPNTQVGFNSGSGKSAVDLAKNLYYAKVKERVSQADKEGIGAISAGLQTERTNLYQAALKARDVSAVQAAILNNPGEAQSILGSDAGKSYLKFLVQNQKYSDLAWIASAKDEAGQALGLSNEVQAQIKEVIRKEVSNGRFDKATPILSMFKDTVKDIGATKVDSASLLSSGSDRRIIDAAIKAGNYEFASALLDNGNPGVVTDLVSAKKGKVTSIADQLNPEHYAKGDTSKRANFMRRVDAQLRAEARKDIQGDGIDLPAVGSKERDQITDLAFAAVKNGNSARLAQLVSKYPELATEKQKGSTLLEAAVKQVSANGPDMVGRLLRYGVYPETQAKVDELTALPNISQEMKQKLQGSFDLGESRSSAKILVESAAVVTLGTIASPNAAADLERLQNLAKQRTARITEKQAVREIANIAEDILADMHVGPNDAVDSNRITEVRRSLKAIRGGNLDAAGLQGEINSLSQNLEDINTAVQAARAVAPVLAAAELGNIDAVSRKDYRAVGRFNYKQANTRNAEGVPIIVLAAEAGDTRMVRALLEKGARTDLTYMKDGREVTIVSAIRDKESLADIEHSVAKDVLSKAFKATGDNTMHLRDFTAKELAKKGQGNDRQTVANAASLVADNAAVLLREATRNSSISNVEARRVAHAVNVFAQANGLTGEKILERGEKGKKYLEDTLKGKPVELRAALEQHERDQRFLTKLDQHRHDTRRYAQIIDQYFGNDLRDIQQKHEDNISLQIGDLQAHVDAGNWNEAKALLEQYPALSNARANDGTSVLYKAAEAGQSDIVHLMVENGADVNQQVRSVVSLTLASDNRTIKDACAVLPGLDQSEKDLMVQKTAAQQVNAEQRNVLQELDNIIMDKFSPSPEYLTARSNYIRDDSIPQADLVREGIKNIHAFLSAPDAPEELKQVKERLDVYLGKATEPLTPDQQNFRGLMERADDINVDIVSENAKLLQQEIVDKLKPAVVDQSMMQSMWNAVDRAAGGRLNDLYDWAMGGSASSVDPSALPPAGAAASGPAR